MDLGTQELTRRFHYYLSESIYGYLWFLLRNGSPPAYKVIQVGCNTCWVNRFVSLIQRIKEETINKAIISFSTCPSLHWYVSVQRCSASLQINKRQLLVLFLINALCLTILVMIKKRTTLKYMFIKALVSIVSISSS